MPTVQLFTDYIVRLMRYIEFMKKCLPLHEDLFNFWYEALPGYEEVGRRRILLGCWGSFQDPDVCDYDYRTMNEWGNAMYVTPGIVVDGKLVTTNLVDINLGIRILLGSSYYDDWDNQEKFVDKDPLGNPDRSAASLESNDHPATAKAGFQRQVHLGHVAPLVGSSGRATTWRSTRGAARLPACGRPRSPARSTSGTSRQRGRA